MPKNEKVHSLHDPAIRFKAEADGLKSFIYTKTYDFCENVKFGAIL